MNRQATQALEKKIRAGKGLEQAAEEAGLDIEAARSYLEGRRATAAAVGDDCLELNAAEAIHYGMKGLIGAVKERNRGVESSELGENGGLYKVKESVIDVEAAKALLAFALNAKKLIFAKQCRAAGGGTVSPDDLFDHATGDTIAMGSWEFKRIK